MLRSKVGGVAGNPSEGKRNRSPRVDSRCEGMRDSDSPIANASTSTHFIEVISGLNILCLIYVHLRSLPAEVRLFSKALVPSEVYIRKRHSEDGDSLQPDQGDIVSGPS